MRDGAHGRSTRGGRRLVVVFWPAQADATLPTNPIMVPETISRLARALAARPRRALPLGDRVAAAVLVPLVVVDNAVHLLFTRRAPSLPVHGGEVAFPGGRRAGQDRDLAETAIRETHEELGVDPGAVRLLGALDDQETVASRFVITPWVGVLPYPYPWRPCPREIASVFTVPVASLCAPGAEREALWDIDGEPRRIPHFPAAGHVIWGATHRITRDLLALLDRTSCVSAS